MYYIKYATEMLCSQKLFENCASRFCSLSQQPWWGCWVDATIPSSPFVNILIREEHKEITLIHKGIT
jgi:hypothetical protein